MRAMRADVVVTNHALLAIDALSDVDVLPEHDVVVIDEAHELVDRVTGVATEELTGGVVDGFFGLLLHPPNAIIPIATGAATPIPSAAFRSRYSCS